VKGSRKKMKKTILLLLSGILICCLMVSGCTKTEPAATDNESATGEEPTLSGEISFSTWGSLEEKKVNEDIIALFESEHPGTKVNLEYIPEEYTTKIDSMFLGDMAPDVIYGHPKYFTKWASEGLLMDLTDRFNATPELMDETKFNTKLYDSFKYEGQNIATVNGADTMLLFYNKTLFDKANVPYPSEDWTWEDLIDAAQKLTEFDENGKPTQYGIAINNSYQAIEAFLFANGGKLFDDMNNPKEVLINSSENIEMLTLLQDLIYKYKAAPTSADSETLGGGFDTGKIAMDINGVWAVVYRKDIKDFTWDIAELPVDEASGGKIPALYAGYAIAKNSKNPELAWEFAKFMQSDEAQKMLAASGLITVINKQIASSPEVIDIEGAPEHHILRVTSLEKSVHNDAVLVNWEEILSKAFTPVIDQLLNNTITPEDAATEMQADFEEMLKK